VSFGDQLAGVYTTPTGRPRNVACMWLSAGLVPKFGPYRLYTQLARRLAEAGFLSLRFDLGGVGDSPRSSASQALEARTEAEIEAALRDLEKRHGIRRVVLGGLCSGAADAFRHAEHDSRVAGLVLIDPFAHETFDARLRLVGLKIAGRLLRYAGIYRPHVGTTRARLVRYHYMEPPESRRILGAVVARGVRTHFVYTGGMRHAFNHPRQLAAMFPRLDLRGLVTVDHFPRTDHTQYLQEDRDALTEAIAARLES
jgi:dienelactone hydrolase